MPGYEDVYLTYLNGSATSCPHADPNEKGCQQIGKTFNSVVLPQVYLPDDQRSP